MTTYNAIVEKCNDTNMYVGYVPRFSGAHSQGKTLDELHDNLVEVIDLLSENETPILETEFVGTQTIAIDLISKLQNKVNN